MRRVEYMERQRDMKKRKSLFGRRRVQVLLTLGVLLIAVSVVIGSGASFTSTSANPANTFTAGNLKHTNSNDGSAILTASKMKPGDTSTGEVTITNDGDIPGVFTLSASGLSGVAGPNGGDFAKALELTVVEAKSDGSTDIIYSGVKMNAIGSVSLGTFTANEARTYEFLVRFPDTGRPDGATLGDNAFKNSSMSIQFDWEATETS